MASVDRVLTEVPALPNPVVDIAQDEAGYSAEVIVERDLAAHEHEAFSDACLRLTPVVRRDGEHEVRGLVSLDEDTLWVYVHELGPGVYSQGRQRAARDLLEELWRLVHEAAAAT